MTGSPRIVVGFDGSPDSMLALEWALAEAHLRDASIDLCHVRKRPRTQDGDDHAGARDLGGEVLARGLEHADHWTRPVPVAARLMAGNPVQQLLTIAADALFLVVGARGTGGFRGLRLRSVSDQVTRHAPCPVVVVPDPGHHRDGSRDRKIVVGVDGSAGSEAALAFAFDEASRRQTELCAIHVFDPSTVQIMANLPQADLRRLHLAASDTLSNLLATHASKHPCVHVCDEVLSGAPAATLTAAASNAELLVLGSRGHGGFATLVLDSTVHSVLHHASCPIAVVCGQVKGGGLGTEARYAWNGQR